MYLLDSSSSNPSNSCSSDFVPSVTTDNTCVWPLVNIALPCTLGKTPTSQDSGLISSILLPSGRLCSLKIISLTHSFSRSCMLFAISVLFASVSSSPYFSTKYAWISSANLSILASLTSLSTACTSWYILSLKFSLISAYTSLSVAKETYSNFGFPTSSFIPSMNLQSFLISSCPAFIQSSIVSFGISSAPASIIVTFSIVPATVNFNLLCSLWATVGFITICPSTYPTFTAAVGPPNGISEIDNATDVPIIAQTSGLLSCSTDKTVATTHTSFLKSFGNKGLIGLSIALDVKIALSAGFPSLFWKLPGIFPTAYSFSS